MTSKWLTWTPPGKISDQDPERESTKLPDAPPASVPSKWLTWIPTAAGVPAPPATKPPRAFPHCPRCASYALYRPNNLGDYQCQTCGLDKITEAVARMVN